MTAPPKGLVARRTISELAEAWLRLDGRPFSLVNYPMFRSIYDGRYKRTLLMTCRQVGKSTLLATFSIIESILIDFFRTLFVAPTQEQTHKFSTSRVGKTIIFSPLIKQHFVGSATTNRVLSRMFKNGSEINFSYAIDDPDRARGNSADRLSLDEVQDMILSIVEPVLRECLSESIYQFQNWGGTPKTNENAIQYLWETSSQTEWVLKCDGCNKYNIIRTEKSFSPAGPICLSCAKLLNPRNGLWIDMKKDMDVKGFHISRAIMPRNVPAAWTRQTDIELATELWKEVYAKLEGRNAYPISKFRNEVIGVSDSVGRRVVTIEMLREASTGPFILRKPVMNQNMMGVAKVAAGIDWSGGGTMMTSRTVLWIFGWIPSRDLYRTLYYQIYPGMNPVDEVMDIAQTLQMYGNIGLVACDRGEGNMPTDMLRKKFDPRRVVKIHYSAESKKYVKWDPEASLYVVNRTVAVDSMMSALYRHEIEFPKDLAASGPIRPPFEDILNEFEEVNRRGNKIWDHSPDKPDDCLHAMIFARLALQLLTNSVDLSS